MSHFDHLVATKDKRELARLVVELAKEKAALKNEVHRLSHELFWMQAAQREES